jgi:hypothetical protein
MNDWYIVCTKKVVVAGVPPHAHIAGVGTGERADWADLRWELEQVLEAMAAGEHFFTESIVTGRGTPVEAYTCPTCHTLQLRSASGAEPDAELDQLRECIYQ